MNATDKKSPSQSQQQDNSILNIILNVLLPVLILNYLSKESEGQYAKLWHLGPYWAMAIALAIPLVYGGWYFLKNRRLNVFSVVGMLSVLLTGIITIYLFSGGLEVRKKAPLLFGMKEAIMPLILGSLFLITHRSAKPLFNIFIYNDSVFDISGIKKAVATNQQEASYRLLLWRATLLFFSSFVISAIVNLILARYFLGDLDPMAANWKELYNKDMARITGWGFLVIGVPFLVVGGLILWFLIRGLKRLTSLPTDRILLPR